MKFNLYTIRNFRKLEKLFVIKQTSDGYELALKKEVRWFDCNLSNNQVISVYDNLEDLYIAMQALATYRQLSLVINKD